MKTPFLVSPPFLALFASQKSAGKTHAATFLADALVVNNIKFQAFQVDDQKRFSHMIGEQVVDLRPDPDKLISDPTLVTRALTPIYEAARLAVANKSVVLLDTGANEVENVANFFKAVEFEEDAQSWNLPVLVFVPFLVLDPESTSQSAFTLRRLIDALPSARVVLVENHFGGSPERLVPGSLARGNYDALLKLGKGLDRIIMPAMAREYWSPFEGAGIRFIKAMSMSPDEGSALLGRSSAEVKIMRREVALFWRAMHAQLSQIISLPYGGA